MQSDDKKAAKEGLKQAVKALAILSGIGIYMAVFVGICGFIGNLIDDFFQLNYTGKLIGIIIGFPLSIYTLYRQLKNNELC